MRIVDDNIHFVFRIVKMAERAPIHRKIMPALVQLVTRPTIAHWTLTNVWRPNAKTIRHASIWSQTTHANVYPATRAGIAKKRSTNVCRIHATMAAPAPIYLLPTRANAPTIMPDHNAIFCGLWPAKIHRVEIDRLASTASVSVSNLSAPNSNVI